MFAPERQPSRLTRAINHVAVTPLAHVTFLNLEYQIYLNQVLHTAGPTWLGHLLCIPLNVGLLFYALAVLAGPGAWPGYLLLGLLGFWYAAMAARMRARLWGLLSLAVLASLWALATHGAELALAASLPWYLHPLTLIVAVSLVQAHSHLFEQHVPPRANFTKHWLPTREFLWGDARRVPLARRLLRLAWTPVGAVWGTIDEWWASSKLLPLYLLELLWMLGYQRAQREQHRRRSLLALASGDPALDWVGIGGGRSIVELEQHERDIAGH